MQFIKTLQTKLEEGDLSYHFNPFDNFILFTDIIKFVDDLLDETDDPNAKNGDEFWGKSEKILLSALIGFVNDYSDKFHMSKNLLTVMDLLIGCQFSDDADHNDSRTTEIFNALENTGWYFIKDSNGKEVLVTEECPEDMKSSVEWYPPVGPDNDCIKKYKWFMTGAGKTLKSIIISLMARLSLLNDSRIADMIK